MTAEAPKPAPPTPRRPWSFIFPAILTLALAVIPAAIFPGDAPYVLDEPALVAKARAANELGRREIHGLNGNFGIPYGPLPTQTYQLLLLIGGNDPRFLVMVRGGASALIVSLCLLWMARSLRLNPWFAPAAVLAPCLWLYHRQLWDASFAIPLSAMALAAYAAFCRDGKRWTLLLAIGAALLLPLIHPQGLPLCIGLLGHLLWTSRPAIRRHALELAAVIAAIFIWHLPYFAVVTGTLRSQLGTAVSQGQKRQVSRVDALTAPLMGGRILAADYFPVPAKEYLPGPPWLGAVAVGASMIPIGLLWLGLIYGAISLRVPCPRSRGHAELDAPLTARRRVTELALIVIVLQMGLYWFMRIPGQPPYLFASFMVMAYLAWLGIESLQPRWWGRHSCLPSPGRVGDIPVPPRPGEVSCSCPTGWLRAAVIAVYGIACAFITLGLIVRVHGSDWRPGDGSPTLVQQIAVAQQLQGYSDETIWTDVHAYQFVHPHALWSLRKLYPPAAEAKPSGARLVIRYKLVTDNPASGRIQLIRWPDDEPLPERFKEVRLDGGP